MAKSLYRTISSEGITRKKREKRRRLCAVSGEACSGLGTMLEYVAMDEVTWSYIVFILASVPWVCYGFAITFFCISLVYG